VWFKHHNAKHYGEIEIDEQNLAMYLEDGIPIEVAAIIHQCMDLGVVDQEHRGYVPSQQEMDGNDKKGKVSVTLSQIKKIDMYGNQVDTSVIPLTSSAVMDFDLSKLTPSEIMVSGLTNLVASFVEPPYAVRHGSKPTPNFRPLSNTIGSDEKDYFERAFPCLFPWGEGGFYRHRAVNLEFHDHVKWALQYFNRRFRLHQTFPFVVFAIIQRRQALASVQIQMKTQQYRKDAQLPSSMTFWDGMTFWDESSFYNTG
jgi:hypothetical protein